MPHFLAPRISLPPLPYEEEGYCFAYEARECHTRHSHKPRTSALDSEISESRPVLESAPESVPESALEAPLESRQSLILVRYGDKEFFLRKAPRNSLGNSLGNSLKGDLTNTAPSHARPDSEILQRATHSPKHNAILKCEKTSRIQPTGIIKTALSLIAKQQETITSHNLNNNSPRQNLISPFLKSIEFFLSFSSRCLIEVGFGSGRHLLHLAQSHPELVCIGIEIHTPSIEQILRQIELLGLKNLYIINTDARILLEILPPHIAHSIYVHFPVPWNKKPHRRVFSQDFLAQALRVLEKGGFVHLRSDDEIYFNDALALAQGLNPKEASFESDKNAKNAITSKYEARWERQKKDIYDLRIFKSSESSFLDLSLSESSPDSETFMPNKGQNTQKTLNFDKILRKNLDNYTNFPYKKIAKDWFLHIDGLYHAKDTRDMAGHTCDIYVLALCFGDFNAPQSRFLELCFREQSLAQCRYINSEPIPTRAAFMAQEHLVEFLSLDS